MDSYINNAKAPDGFVANFYHILGVEQDTDNQTIKTILRRCFLTSHPDKLGDVNPDPKLVQEASEAFRFVNYMQKILQDPEKKREYDFKLNYTENKVYTRRTSTLIGEKHRFETQAKAAIFKDYKTPPNPPSEAKKRTAPDSSEPTEQEAKKSKLSSLAYDRSADRSSAKPSQQEDVRVPQQHPTSQKSERAYHKTAKAPIGKTGFPSQSWAKSNNRRPPPMRSPLFTSSSNAQRFTPDPASKTTTGAFKRTMPGAFDAENFASEYFFNNASSLHPPEFTFCPKSAPAQKQQFEVFSDDMDVDETPTHQHPEINVHFQRQPPTVYPNSAPPQQDSFHPDDTGLPYEDPMDLDDDSTHSGKEDSNTQNSSSQHPKRPTTERAKFSLYSGWDEPQVNKASYTNSNRKTPPEWTQQDKKRPDPLKFRSGSTLPSGFSVHGRNDEKQASSVSLSHEVKSPVCPVETDKTPLPGLENPAGLKLDTSHPSRHSLTPSAPVEESLPSLDDRPLRSTPSLPGSGLLDGQKDVKAAQSPHLSDAISYTDQKGSAKPDQKLPTDASGRRSTSVQNCLSPSLTDNEHTRHDACPDNSGKNMESTSDAEIDQEVIKSHRTTTMQPDTATIIENIVVDNDANTLPSCEFPNKTCPEHLDGVQIELGVLPNLETNNEDSLSSPDQLAVNGIKSSWSSVANPKPDLVSKDLAGPGQNHSPRLEDKNTLQSTSSSEPQPGKSSSEMSSVAMDIPRIEITPAMDTQSDLHVTNPALLKDDSQRTRPAANTAKSAQCDHDVEYKAAQEDVLKLASGDSLAELAVSDTDAGDKIRYLPPQVEDAEEEQQTIDDLCLKENKSRVVRADRQQKQTKGTVDDSEGVLTKDTKCHSPKTSIGHPESCSLPETPKPQNESVEAGDTNIKNQNCTTIPLFVESLGNPENEPKGEVRPLKSSDVQGINGRRTLSPQQSPTSNESPGRSCSDKEKTKGTTVNILKENKPEAAQDTCGVIGDITHQGRVETVHADDGITSTIVRTGIAQYPSTTLEVEQPPTSKTPWIPIRLDNTKPDMFPGSPRVLEVELSIHLDEEGQVQNVLISPFRIKQMTLPSLPPQQLEDVTYRETLHRPVCQETPYYSVEKSTIDRPITVLNTVLAMYRIGCVNEYVIESARRPYKMTDSRKLDHADRTRLEADDTIPSVKVQMLKLKSEKWPDDPKCEVGWVATPNNKTLLALTVTKAGDETIKLEYLGIWISGVKQRHREKVRGLCTEWIRGKDSIIAT